MRVTSKENYISLNEAKHYIKVEHDQDNDYITDLIAISIEQADLFLQNDFRKQDENGEWVDLPVPFSIKLACLKMIASWYETRTDDQPSVNAGGAVIQLGEIPWDSQRLMYPYRKLVGL